MSCDSHLLACLLTPQKFYISKQVDITINKNQALQIL